MTIGERLVKIENIISAFKVMTVFVLMLSTSYLWAATYEGRLHKVIGDNPTEGQPVDRYYLVDKNGKWHRLHIESQVLNKLGPVHEWQGGQFRVETREPEDSAGAMLLPIVIDIQQLTSMDEGRAHAMENADELMNVPESRPWINLLVRFADDPDPTPPKPSSFYVDMMSDNFPGLDDYWREVSYESINIEGSQVAGWYTLPQNRDYYIDSSGDPNFERTIIDATSVANADVHFPDFEGINIFFAGSFVRGWGGTATLDIDGEVKSYAATWLPVWTHSYHAYVAHEMGHGFGLPHSSGPYGNTYDSVWDPMSNSFGSCGGDNNPPHPDYGCISVHTIGFHKELLGWIPPDHILSFEAAEELDELVELERVALLDFASGRPTVLKLPLPGGRFYTVEARLRSGYDANIPGDAVVIHEVVPGRSSPAQVVDDSDNGNPNDEGAQWIPGETAELDDGWYVTIEDAFDTYFSVRVTRQDEPPQEVSGLNLEVWNPMQTSTVTKVAARITNHTDTPIALNRLSIKSWFNDQGYPSWMAASYGYNQAVFTANDSWLANVAAPMTLSFLSMNGVVDCGKDRTANREVTIQYESPDTIYIPANGGYMTTHLGGAGSLATWNRSDWGVIDRSQDYSRISDAGTDSWSRFNLAEFALYLDGDLVTESLSATQLDPQTGREPCYTSD